MAIATSTAILASAAVAAGATAYGASKSSAAAKSAANAAQQSAAENNALQREVYGQNTANLSPFMMRGNAAGDSINALLGLPTAGQAGSSGGYNPAAQPDWAAYAAARPDLQASYQRLMQTADFNSPWAAEHGLTQGGGPEAYYKWHYENHGRAAGDELPMTGGAAQAQQPQGDPNAAAQAAFKQYQDSTGHQFRLKTGANALTSNRLTAGLGRSGATLKALTQYGQDVGTGDFNNYLGLLSGQQNVGLSGANALAGVGTNYANAVGANNDSAASARGNAALVGAGQTNALMGQLASAAGNAAGAYGSSYGGGGGTFSGAPQNPAMDWSRNGYVLTGSPRL
jgi:hypothetical protein